MFKVEYLEQYENAQFLTRKEFETLYDAKRFMETECFGVADIADTEAGRYVYIKGERVLEKEA